MNFSRRAMLRMSTAAVALLPLGLVPGACSGGAEGPGPIKVGRDVCAFCGMIVSDARYAAELRGGPDNTLHIFDDLGCAITFAHRAPWGEEARTGFWAMNHQDGVRWLEAREAGYLGGLPTPMGHGFAAVPKGTPGAVDLETARRVVLGGGDPAHGGHGGHG